MHTYIHTFIHTYNDVYSMWKSILLSLWLLSPLHVCMLLQYYEYFPFPCNVCTYCDVYLCSLVIHTCWQGLWILCMEILFEHCYRDNALLSMFWKDCCFVLCLCSTVELRSPWQRVIVNEKWPPCWRPGRRRYLWRRTIVSIHTLTATLPPEK